MKARIGVARALVALSLGLAGIALFCLAWHEGGRETDRDGEGIEEREARGDSPDEALRFRRLQLQDEHGVIPTDGLRKAREQMAVMKDAQERKARAFGKGGETDVAGIKPGQWEWLGPGNVGGRIRSIVIDPANANKMWVGSVSGGIWSSSDAGGSWLPVNDFAANLAVSTMVIDPTNSSVMYAGTGESFAASLSAEGQGFTPEGLRGDGVFKSSDGGVTWNQLPSTDSTNPAVCAAGGGTACPWSYVNRLAMSPDGSTILAATIAGIYRSTDGGATWSPAPSATGIFLDIDFDPTNSQNAIAGATGGAPSVFSTNGGQSWQRATYNPPIAPNGSSGRIELAYAPSNPSIVYASIDVTRTPPAPAAAVMGDIYQSTDGGQTYTLLNTINPGNTFLGLQGSYGNIIWVNPQNPNFVIVGGINLYRSTDGGINWSGIANGGNGSAHSDHHMIVAAPGFNNTANKTVYFSNDGGIYRADDVSTVSLTSGWTKLNNSLGITQFYGAAANAAGVIVGGTQDNGTVRYSGNLQSWTTMFGGDGGYAAADPTDNNYFFGEYINLGILRSTDGGNSSGYIYCNPVPTLPNGQPNPNGGPCTGTGIMDAFNGANFIAPFLLDPNNPNTMLAGGLSLWRSNDIKASGLPTWTAIKSPASNGLIPASNVPISAIAVAANNSNFIVVGHNDGQIYLTSDGTGATPPTSPSWSRISNGTPARFVTRVVIDQTKSPNWIYATFGGFTADNIYRTTDLGVTWTDVTGTGTTSLPDVPVRSLAISPANANYLYAGTEVGIFASEDGGATWGLPQDGPANVSVDDLFWLSGKLVAVTHGRGLYKSNMPVYNFTVCNPPPNCGCFGDWDCPCSWNSGQVPTINDDVAVVCPITVQQAANVRNLTVNNNFLLNGTLTVAQDIVNYGKITDVTQVGWHLGVSGSSLCDVWTRRSWTSTATTCWPPAGRRRPRDWRRSWKAA